MYKLSELLGKNVYSDKGVKLGKVYDVIFDLQQGTVSRICLSSFEFKNKEDFAKQIKQKTIAFENILSISDSILVNSKPSPKFVLEKNFKENKTNKSMFQQQKHVFSYRYLK